MSHAAPTTITIGDVAFLVDATGSETFWHKVRSGRWEPATFQVFRQHIDAQTTFVDIGGWIGPTTLYGGQLAQKTITLEPDPTAFATLGANVAMNEDRLGDGRVELINAALWTERTTLTLQSGEKVGDSTSSILRAMSPRTGAEAAADGSTFEATTIEISDIHARLPDDGPVFVKMDIEGAEYLLLEHILAGLVARKAVLFVSTHAQMLHTDAPNLLTRRRRQAASHRAFVEMIRKAGYRVQDRHGRDYNLPFNTWRWLLLGKMDKDLLCVVD